MIPNSRPTLVALTALMLSVSGSYVRAQGRAQITFGQEYRCSGGSQRFVVRSCKPVYTFETCDVQYLNSAAANGLGARVDLRKETLEASLGTCTVAGKVVQSTAPPSGQPGQALYLGTWYDVTVLGRSGDKIRVRWSSGTEDLMDANKVRGTAVKDQEPVHGSNNAALKAGAYHCTGYSGHLFTVPGFTVDAGGNYVHQQGTRGKIALANGEASFQRGALAGQHARYEPSSGGHAVLRLYNEAHTRTVIDCEGPPN